MNVLDRLPCRGGKGSEVGGSRLGLIILMIFIGLVASLSSPQQAMLVPAAMLALFAMWLAGRFTGALIYALMLAVIFQDAIVGLGFSAFQRADEALVLLGLSGLALAWLIRNRRRIVGAFRVQTGEGSSRVDGIGVIRSPLDLASLGFIAAGLAGAAWIHVPFLVAALGMLALLKGVLAFQISARWPRLPEKRRLEWLLLSLVWIGAGLCIIALAQRVVGAPVYALMGRIEYFDQWQGGKAPSIFYNHNAFGHIAVYSGALALGLILGSRKNPSSRDGQLIVAGMICLAGLVVSASRESWIGAVAGLSLMALLLRRRRLVQLSLVFSVLVALGGAAIYSASDLMRAEIARRSLGVLQGWHHFQLGYTGWNYRGEYRLYVILKSWEVFKDHLWLGTGPGRFGGYIATLYPSPVYEQYRFLPLDGAYIPLDVFWSRLLTEFGLIGSAFYLLAFLIALRIFYVAARDDLAEPLRRGLGIAGLIIWGAIFTFGIFAPALEDPLSAIPFWLLAGLVWRMGREGRLA